MQQVSVEAQEQLEAKDRIIQKLAANNKEKDNLLAVNSLQLRLFPDMLLFYTHAVWKRKQNQTISPLLIIL